MTRGSDPVKVQQWMSRLKRFGQSGLTVARFCQDEGVSQPSFYQWKRKLAARAAFGEQPVSKTGGQAGSVACDRQANGSASGSFRPVQLISAAVPDPCMRVRMPGGIELALTDNLAMIEMVVDKLLETLPGKSLPAESGERSC